MTPSADPLEDLDLRRLTLPLLAVLFIGLLALAPAFAEDPEPTEIKIAQPDTTKKADPPPDRGDTAWMLVSTGLVLLMVPGLALFYGGMVRRKNVLGTMMHSMVALAIIGIQWLLFGYCLAFGASQGGLIGWKPDFLGLNGVLSNQLFPGTHIPILRPLHVPGDVRHHHAGPDQRRRGRARSASGRIACSSSSGRSGL